MTRLLRRHFLKLCTGLRKLENQKEEVRIFSLHRRQTEVSSSCRVSGADDSEFEVQSDSASFNNAGVFMPGVPKGSKCECDSKNSTEIRAGS